MTDRELMQQALEALDEAANVLTWDGFQKAAEALRERLAQPEPQAPRPDYRDWDYQDQLEQSPLDRMAENARELGLDYAPEQEPVAWMSPGKERLEFSRKDTVYGSHTIPLYTTPPRREWVGLTEEEIYPLYSEPSSDAEMVEFARAIEAKLREKNA